MWHVSSHSSVATLRTAIHLFLTYLQSHDCSSQPLTVNSCVQHSMHEASRCTCQSAMVDTCKIYAERKPICCFDRLLFPTVLSWHLWQFLLSTNDDSTRNSSPGLRAFVTFVCYFTATAVQGKCCGPLEMEYCIRHLKQQVRCCKWSKEILKRS